MERPLRIYLADLTYDTIALSTEVFPLNVGYVAAYCLHRFGADVEIRLFKYIEDLDAALQASPPDVLGLSNYCWNRRVGLEMIRMLLQRNAHAVTVWGGPNFPADWPSRQDFMDKYPEVDVYVPIEGEIGFSNIVESVLEAGSTAEAKERVRTSSIDGCINRTSQGQIQYSNPVIRIRDLDGIPSPYLLGLMDKFFDGRLIPMIQTNRGCPFTCTYCVDGSSSVAKVNQFGVDRVEAELKYIAERVPATTHGLEISDLNFGMYKRDLAICQTIKRIQEVYNWPKHIQTSTGKNKKDRVIEALQTLSGSLRLTMSVQSTDQEVLRNISRDNISLDAMMELAPTISGAGLKTYSEVILSLPGETYESHVNTMRELTQSNIEAIKGYTLMLLDGSELATPEERAKWGLKTKYRLLTMDFATLSNGKKVLEHEEVVVGSNTMSFDEYVELRVLAFALFVTNRGVAYDALLKYLRENGVDVLQLVLNQVKRTEIAPKNVSDLLKAFRQSTIQELWDSPEEIEAHYQDEKAYAKLLAGEEGVNLLNYYNGILTSECIEGWTDYTIEIARDLCSEGNWSEEKRLQFEDVASYCRGITHDVMAEDRRERNPEYVLSYDIEKWLADEAGRSLEQFAMSYPVCVSFRLTEEQCKVLDDLLNMHGRSVAGRGQALKYVPVNMLWRHPEQVPVATVSDLVKGVDKPLRT